MLWPKLKGLLISFQTKLNVSTRASTQLLLKHMNRIKVFSANGNRHSVMLFHSYEKNLKRELKTGSSMLLLLCTG